MKAKEAKQIIGNILEWQFVLNYEWLKKSGKKTNGFKMLMLIDDRLLAAVYTIINYDPQDQVVAAYNDKGTAIVNLKYS